MANQLSEIFDAQLWREVQGFEQLTDITYHKHNQLGIVRVAFNRPEVRNAFNDEVIAELKAAFEAAGQAPDVRCVVLAAEGPAFCAGADLNWMRRMADYTRDQNLADAAQLAAMLRAIYTCAKPTLARVQGDVYAGGLGLVAACDMAVSVDTAHYCLSEVKIGLIPATISPYVVRAIGARQSYRYFQSAERIDAVRAHELGLVHEAVEPEQLDAKVQEIVDALIQGGPLSQAAAKDLIRAVDNKPINDAVVEDTAQRIAGLRATPEAQDGLSAFLDKRQPRWLA